MNRFTKKSRSKRSIFSMSALTKYSLLSQQSWGSKHPEIASEFAARPVAQNFYNFPLESLIRITSNIIIRFLHYEGILKEQNAKILALAYIKSFENIAKTCNKEYQQPTNLKQYNCQYETLGKGFTNFVNSIVRMTPEKAWRLAIDFGNSFTLESIEHGPGNY
ncbi:hypothetical protein TNCV_3961621 [Trichonephila clavipes]|nr:hypothetical protein TNCV_3961621 [Trichonephila clavipes]